jgi:hypothetical protein
MEEKDERDRLSPDTEEGPDVEGHGTAPPGEAALGATTPPGRSDEGDDDVEAHQHTPPSANI